MEKKDRLDKILLIPSLLILKTFWYLINIFTITAVIALLYETGFIGASKLLYNSMMAFTVCSILIIGLNIIFKKWQKK